MPNLKNYKKSVPTNKDEFYTPRILVDAIIPYIPKDKIVWCPFDTADSEFVSALVKNGNQVYYSHIWEGNDFFDYTPNNGNFDLIVSNPPFTKKKEVLKRLWEIGKPFAMVMGLPILNYQVMGKFFIEHEGLQLLIVDKKVSFDGNTSSFNNSYFCKDLLPKDLMFTHLEHNNSNENFVPSGMYNEPTKEEH
jgi:hypothetical protein